MIDFAARPILIGAILSGALGIAQSSPPASGPAVGDTPAWFLQDSFPDPGGRTIVDPDGHVTVPPRTAGGGRSAGSAAVAVPPCGRSPLCGNRQGRARQSVQHVQWKQTMGYTFTYPYVLPPGFGGVPAVALDSKGNLWAFQRADAGKPQLFKFDPNYKLILQVGPDVTGYQDKAHGMAVDAEDNVWITAASGATVMKISPDGRLLLTIGERGRRGDWNEAKGQRLLWQPVMIAFARNGDVYIGEGHANESPNDTDSDDPANNIGAARIIHLDKNGKFINQWYGNEVGQGKFSSAHGLAVDPASGDVWIGDREEYRIVVYSGDGKFIKTMQMRNLVCALYFDSHGQPWMASGQDGQFLKLDRNGRVLGAIGNGMGIGTGQFIEASYWAMDKQDNLYAGDTSVGRVTRMVAPQNAAARLPASAELLEKTGTFAGLKVTYKVVLPNGYDPAKTYPLILVFTGGPQTLQIATSTVQADWQKEAERRGYIVVAPASPNGELFFEGADRIFPSFLDQMLKDYKVGKVHVAGHSNGGLSTFHIAAKYPKYFTTVIGYPGLLDGPDRALANAIKDKCLFMHVGDRDDGWKAVMEEQAKDLASRGFKIRITVEKNQVHRLKAAEIDLSRRLFDEIESCR